MTYKEALKEYLHQCEECKAFVKMNCDACRTKMAIKALELQIHTCKDCRNADYNANSKVIFCLEHMRHMRLDDYCTGWERE